MWPIIYSSPTREGPIIHFVFALASPEKIASGFECCSLSG